MTILEGLQQANHVAGIKNFSFADVTSFNSFVDSYKGLDFPLNLVVPVTVNSTLTQPRTQDIAIISGFVITRLKEDTNDFRHIDIEDSYINPMRILAKKFLVALINNPELYNEQNQTPVTAQINPEYQWLPVHLFGVSYRAAIPLKAKVC